VSFVNPFSHDLGGGADPFFSSVVLLCHFDGTNGQTTTVNSCPRGSTVSLASGATLSTTQKQFGATSLLLAGGVSQADAASHADYTLGTGDFSIEGWARPTSSSGVFIDFRPASNGLYPTIYFDTGGVVKFFQNNADRITSAGSAITLNAWNFIQAIRISGTTQLAVNGSQVGSNYTDLNSYIVGATGIHMGLGGFGTGPMPGNIDEVRVTKGVGRALNLPFAAFPDS
jgi:hypothetical protein